MNKYYVTDRLCRILHIYIYTHIILCFEIIIELFGLVTNPVRHFRFATAYLFELAEASAHRNVSNKLRFRICHSSQKCYALRTQPVFGKPATVARELIIGWTSRKHDESTRKKGQAKGFLKINSARNGLWHSISLSVGQTWQWSQKLSVRLHEALKQMHIAYNVEWDITFLRRRL
jgi:hypothetical protein